MTQRRRSTAQSSATAYCATLVRTFPSLRQHLHQKKSVHLDLLGHFLGWLLRESHLYNQKWRPMGMGESLGLLAKREYEGTRVEEQRGKPCWGTTGRLSESQSAAEGFLQGTLLLRRRQEGVYNGALWMTRTAVTHLLSSMWEEKAGGWQTGTLPLNLSPTSTPASQGPQGKGKAGWQ